MRYKPTLIKCYAVYITVDTNGEREVLTSCVLIHCLAYNISKCFFWGSCFELWALKWLYVLFCRPCFTLTPQKKSLLKPRTPEQKEWWVSVPSLSQHPEWQVRSHRVAEREGGCCDLPTALAEVLSTVCHWQTYCPSTLLQDNATSSSTCTYSYNMQKIPHLFRNKVHKYVQTARIIFSLCLCPSGFNAGKPQDERRGRGRSMAIPNLGSRDCALEGCFLVTAPGPDDPVAHFQKSSRLRIPLQT